MNMHGNRLQQAMDESTAVTVRFFGGALPMYVLPQPSQ